MRSYIVLFAISAIASFLLTPLVRRLAIRWGAVDLPGGRRIHAQPTPRLGGVAIYISFVLTLLFVPLPGNMVSDTFRDSLPQILALLVPATLIFLFGVYDDLRGSTASMKIIVQMIVGAFVYFCGFRIDAVSLPFGGAWEPPVMAGFLLTLFWIVLITNAFNLIDGIDGLAAGASVFALFSILGFSIAMGVAEISLITVILIGAVLGFLRHNFNPATIFLGDSGSLFLGFMAATLSLAGSQKSSTIVAIAIPLVSFGLPVMETGLSITRRFLNGTPIMGGDREHIHHMLLRRGLSQRQTVILLYGVCALFSVFGLMLLNPQRTLSAFIFFIVGVGIVFGVQHLRYAEFSELGSQIRRGMTRRRRAMSVNVQVRKFSGDLSESLTLDDFLRTLGGMLAINEFDCAFLEVRGKLIGAGAAAARGANPFARGGEDTGEVIWTWERGDMSLDEALVSDQFWTLRLPLTDETGKGLGALTFYRCLQDGEMAVDLYNLCGPFQKEVSAALSVMLKKAATQASEAGETGFVPAQQILPAPQ
ncbi:MAG: glycosyltransferase family 4 protein [Blastocatellia bacterium]